MRREVFLLLTAALWACGQAASASGALAGPHDALIAKHAAANGVPEQLVRRVIRVESRGNPRAVHAGNYGLMQIRLATARGVGYTGDAQGLLDPDTNLTYAVKYLAGAYRAAGCDADRAVSYYMRGYYGAAQRQCNEAPQIVQVARAEKKPDAAAAKADVIKPKVVRTETIATPSGSGPARPVGNFEPKRVAPPPVQPVAVANPAPPKPEPLKPEETPKSDMLTPAVTEPAAKFELASIPLPPVRRELESPPKRNVPSAHRPARLHERADKKVADKKAGVADTSGPAGVVSFLKKLVTPDKKSRKPAVEAEADALPQVPPPP
jgi:hypothetical protein